MRAKEANGDVLAGLLRRAYLEVIPTRTILERLIHIPRHSYVSITCSPVNGLEPTLELTERLKALPEERQLRVIPHVAARMVRDRDHLREVLRRLADSGVKSIFVPGGDSAEPAGQFHCSLDLLREMADIGHEIEYVGVASHPEGHPRVEEGELLRLLVEKEKYANYFVTQMCFDPAALINWLRRVRDEGITMGAWIGLPGVAELPKLISLSMRIGVGQSLQVLKKQKGLIRKMISAKPYRPNDLLDGLLPHLGDPRLNIEGFHLFSFNNVERTERWRLEVLAGLDGDGHA